MQTFAMEARRIARSFIRFLVPTKEPRVEFGVVKTWTHAGRASSQSWSGLAPLDIVFSKSDAKAALITASIGSRVVCRSGTVWLTLDYDSADHVLSAGDIRLVPVQSRCMIQGLGESWVQLEAH